MKFAKTTIIVLLASAVAVAAFAKKDKPKSDTTPSTASTASGDSKESGNGQVAAVVSGEEITMDDLDKAAANQLVRIRQQEFQVRSDALSGLIQQKMITKEAAARKISEDELVKNEIDSKVAAVTPEEIQQYYDKMKPRLGDKKLEDVKGDIEKALRQQKYNERRGQFLNELSAKNDVKILLDPPRSMITLRPTAPSIGPANAPVTIVEWSDYQCPFCKRAHPTVEQVLNEYKDKVRFIYLDYPLPFHQMAMPASVAAHCAEDQGKFWEYHKNLFEVAGDLSKTDLTKRASDLGLDGPKFEACTDQKKHEDLIKTNFDDGSSLGVTGTPAFFINGRMLVGAQPIEQFRDIINDELTRKGIPVPKPAAPTGTN